MKLTNIFATPRQIIENDKESMFAKFQKNNRPSGIGYIKDNCVDYMFEAIKEDVLSTSEASKVIIKSVSAEVIDYNDENGVKIASIHYICTMVIDEEIEEIDEVWHFSYSGWNWKLAGIEQV